MTDIAAPTQTALTRIVTDRQTKGRVPGLLGGLARDGKLAWSAGVGSASLDEPGVPPTADSQFLIASQSKTLTAVAIMALRDEGRLSLDDTADRLIPESKHEGITVRQMLSHVTGMQREPVGDVWDQMRFPDRAELVAGWNEAERIGKPHHRFHYSNLVYSLLGEIVARLDGRSWYESIRARILDPLEMRRTTVGMDGGPAAKGYYVPPFTDVPVAEPLLDLGAMDACGGLASTAEDLAKWAMFLADPTDEVLSADTLDEMCQPQIMADLDRWQLGFGLGFMLLRVGERVFIGHTGGMPGHITGTFLHRASGTAGIALMNTTSAPSPAALATDLAVKVLDEDPVLAPAWTPGTTVPPELADVLGTWFTEGAPFVFSVREGHLEARSPAAPDHQAPAVFERIGEDLYRTISGRETGELLRITRTPEGTPEKLHWATYLCTRQPLAFGQHL
ncbi:CubicO group peptidase (beta-lactamase class C family) [Kribbella amoyensis]|uniref:CubicO group peptidase (Beta-lactamase class C family) n=1 Tax=Kribbella amoyensis TaxID=996641 RepID=A0A561BN78_9ACTN|nr:serine hydrolase domain-containing protein [Kribbella amoyensis]TWD80346.1 CubicO group peptidase (beta-lactamase class C family) [Kribbella amoyensis]